MEVIEVPSEEDGVAFTLESGNGLAEVIIVGLSWIAEVFVFDHYVSELSPYACYSVCCRWSVSGNNH